MEINLTSFDEARELIQREIRDSGETFGSIASATGLNIQTVARIAYGETKRPQYRTVMLLIVYFGYRVFARRSNLPAVELPAGVRKLEVRKARRA